MKHFNKTALAIAASAVIFSAQSIAENIAIVGARRSP